VGTNTMTYSAQKLHACIGAAFYSSMGAAVVTCNAGLDARIIYQVGALLSSCIGNGQTYATRGVPYYRVSRIFMSRIFSVPKHRDQCLQTKWSRCIRMGGDVSVFPVLALLSLPSLLSSALSPLFQYFLSATNRPISGGGFL